ADSRVKAADCFFQVGITMAAADGQALFCEYKVLGRVSEASSDDPDQLEEASLELLYRKRKAFAVGHGTSVDWDDEIDGHVKRVSTATIPRVKVPPVEPRSAGGDELSMYYLSRANGTVPPEAIPTTLGQLAADYQRWIEEQNTDDVPKYLQEAAK